jgi:hypothetical protein
MRGELRIMKRRKDNYTGAGIEWVDNPLDTECLHWYERRGWPLRMRAYSVLRTGIRASSLKWILLTLATPFILALLIALAILLFGAKEKRSMPVLTTSPLISAPEMILSLRSTRRRALKSHE